MIETQTAMPSSPAKAQALMRQHGIRGLKVESIDHELQRIYCLTGPKLGMDGRMTRRPQTVITRITDEGFELIRVRGWHVDDSQPWDILGKGE